MLTERVNQSYTSTKYYQFATFLEHVIDCFHTIVSDETNPYHPPLAWLTRKQPKPPEDELFLDIIDECSREKKSYGSSQQSTTNGANSNSSQLSYSVRTRLERCLRETRKEIVSRTKDGCAPLFIACRNGLTGVAKYLIETCDADIEQNGLYEVLEDHHIHSVSPIWVGSVCGQIEIVKLLIECGANINSLSDTGSTPLRSICFRCNDDDDVGDRCDPDANDGDHFDADGMFGLLVDEEEEGERQEKDASDPYMNIVKLLIEHGADIHRPNYNGGTCLINSLHNYHLTECILDHGADVNATDNQSKSALHYAIQQGRLEVVKLLIARGANPFLCANSNDDALQYCCLGGNIEIFEYLRTTFQYTPKRLADAHKLLGSSILEIYHDLSRVRDLWTISLKYTTIGANSQAPESTNPNGVHVTNDDHHHDNDAYHDTRPSLERNNYNSENNDNLATSTNNIRCDIRRSIAYGDMVEFSSEQELQALTVDDYKIQSLLISERILGSNHRETIQRLLYRGTFFINSLRPDKCIDLWIYALKLRLDYGSIFHFESIFAAQAITKLFLDLFSQQQQHQIKFCDVYDVLNLLVERLDDCKRQLSWRPTSCLHQDIFDLLLGIIVNLLLASRCIAKEQDVEERAKIQDIINKIVAADPRSSNESSLLHLCVSPSLFDGDAYRSLTISLTTNSRDGEEEGEAEAGDVRRHQQTINSYQQQHEQQQNLSAINSANVTKAVRKTKRSSPIVELIETLIDSGLNIDLANEDGLSALQTLCLTTSICRSTDKREIVRLLVERGAHVDRRTLTPEQDERIRQALHEVGINPLNYTTLACLAARQVAKLKLKLKLEDDQLVARHLRAFVAAH